MSSSDDILRKFNQLKEGKHDLGAKIGAEQNAGSGGRVQVYENGRIYWHRNTGAHEVHGGILKRYLDEGGPGANPDTGRRHFGYPISDEGRTKDGSFPVSHFEFGSIFFVRGMKGGVTIHGDFFQAWKAQGSEIGSLAYPLTEPIPVAGGVAVYFERGCMWKGPSTAGKIITGTVHPPLLGKPDLVTLSGGEVRNFLTAQWRGIDKPLKDTILQKRPGLFSEIWGDRLLVQRVHENKNFRDKIVLVPQETDIEETLSSANVRLVLRLPTNGPIRPRERTLYDLALRVSDKETRIMAPHAFYMVKDWGKFGFIHVTDIHVAKRIERFQVKLARLATQNPDLREAANQFNNFNDNFRDFIRYSNHLHDLGLLDIILATGDLVDYGFEHGEAKNQQGGNYAFFEQLIRGQGHASSGVVNEELRVPIFTVFGNHDYRIHPYKLLFDLDIPASKDPELENYSPYNLTKKEAKALQGGHPTVSMEDSLKMVKIDTNDQQDLYRYYKKRINAESAYILDLGPHRIVMLDTRFDVGIPGNTNLGTQITLLLKKLMGTFSENEKHAQNGGPNLKGFELNDIEMTRKALREAGHSGLVIVGMHAPPLNIESSEFAHFFRETEHPTSDRRDVEAFLSRHGASGSNSDWPRNGTTHFKTGTIDNLLDDGVAKGEITAFLETCAGRNGRKPVDLVLCGHNHDRVEYRLETQNNVPGLRFFTDFYLGNPDRYYPSIHADGEKVHIRIKDNVSLNERISNKSDHRFDPPLKFKQLDVPSYAQSLDNIADDKLLKSAWWSKRRPLIVQTAALGPVDHRQRIIVPGRKPVKSFQGFRYFKVKQNEIFESHYVVLDQLRRHDFKMPWEKGDGVSPPGPIKPSKPQPFPDPGQVPNPGTIIDQN